MIIEESLTSDLLQSDVLVKVEQEEATVAPPVRYDKINVVASKPTAPPAPEAKATVDLNGLVIVDKETVKDSVLELSELNFSGEIKIWNVPLTPEIIKEMSLYGQTVVCLSGRLDDFKTQDFGDLIVFGTVTTEDTTEYENLATTTKRGIMIDINKEGKLLYSLSDMLSVPSQIKFTNSISNPNFSGINNDSVADYLDDKGLSYFVKTSTKTWLRGFFIGMVQGIKVYYDEIVKYNTKFAVAKEIGNGKPYDSDSLGELEVAILSTISSLYFIDGNVSVNISPIQQPQNIQKGIVSGITVNYRTSGEIRTVYVTLGGV